MKSKNFGLQYENNYSACCSTYKCICILHNWLAAKTVNNDAMNALVLLVSCEDIGKYSNAINVLFLLVS